MCMWDASRIVQLRGLYSGFLPIEQKALKNKIYPSVDDHTLRPRSPTMSCGAHPDDVGQGGGV